MADLLLISDAHAIDLDAWDDFRVRRTTYDIEENNRWEVTAERQHPEHGTEMQVLFSFEERDDAVHRLAAIALGIRNFMGGVGP